MGIKISRTDAAALSDMIEEARAARGWSQEQLAAAANDATGQVSEDGDLLIERHHIQTLEGSPRFPLSRRDILLAVVVALELDRAQVNRLAGGL